MITIFEAYKNPDLRMIDDYVMCIKNYHKKYKDRNVIFKKGNSYKVAGFYGDAEKSIEKYNINNYLPIECMNKVIMFFDDTKKMQEFDINNNYNELPNFLDYFYVPEFTNDTHKYNI